VVPVSIDRDASELGLQGSTCLSDSGADLRVMLGTPCGSFEVLALLAAKPTLGRRGT
jgi:hypothetical protein